MWRLLLMVDFLVQREVLQLDIFSPEAASGGPIGLIKDGDEITIDLINRKLDVDQPQEELYRRREELKPFKAKVKTGYLARYTALVTSANTGGIMQVPENLI